MTYQLPENFFFGAAMSGPQTEGSWNVGGRLRSYWDMYSDMEINAFHNNVGSYVGNDMYHKYEEDIKLLKSMNFKSFRTSIILLVVFISSYDVTSSNNSILEPVKRVLASDSSLF